MAAHHKGDVHLRRLYCAPDTTYELLATTDSTVVASLNYTPAAEAVTVVPEDSDTAPRVHLPFPAVDLAWCPFKHGQEEASFITTCRGQPLQLWDLDDASLRASYVAANDSDYHVHAHAVCWFGDTAHQHWIAGGYGGFEDSTQVRVFDVVAEGNQPVWTYKAQRSKGLVSALRDCLWPGTTSLLAVGFFNAAVVHLIDCRSKCPAADLRGLQHGVQTLRSYAHDPFHVYAGGSQGDGRIACWDVRQPCTPLFSMARSVHTNQVFDFDLLPAAPDSPHTRRLVSSSSAGGVQVYTWKEGETPAMDSGVQVEAAVGPTSGLAVVDAERVVATTGCREYRLPSRDRPVTIPRKSSAAEGDEAGDGDMNGDRPDYPQHKRARSPMAEEDSDVDGAGEAVAEARSKTACADAANVVVITLKGC